MGCPPPHAFHPRRQTQLSVEKRIEQGQRTARCPMAKAPRGPGVVLSHLSPCPLLRTGPPAGPLSHCCPPCLLSAAGTAPGALVWVGEVSGAARGPGLAGGHTVAGPAQGQIPGMGQVPSAWLGGLWDSGRRLRSARGRTAVYFPCRERGGARANPAGSHTWPGIAIAGLDAWGRRDSDGCWGQRGLGPPCRTPGAAGQSHCRRPVPGAGCWGFRGRQRAGKA